MKQQIRFCTAPDGVRIAYATTGDGPVLVKAANWLNHLEYEIQNPTMRAWVAALSEHYTLVRYDERGSGLSDWDVERLSLDALVEDLEAVVDTLGVTRFPLLGISQGGPVAVAYAARHPERVSRLVLYGSYARNWLTSPQRRTMADSLLQLTKLGWGNNNPAFRQIFSTMMLPEAGTTTMKDFTELQRRSASPRNAARLLAMFYELDVGDLAPAVRAPTLVAHCRHDGAIPFDEGRKLAALIPDAEFLSLESNNHILLEGEPAWTRLMTAIDRFLQPEREAAAVHEAFPTLTAREDEVLELIARGLDNTTIAERLFISPKTVRNHITRIFRKMDVRDRAQAIVRAREAGYGRNGA